MRVNISAFSLGEMSYDNRLDDYTPVQGAGLNFLKRPGGSEAVTRCKVGYMYLI